MLRRVGLPGGIPGGLYLDGMPGRTRPLECVWGELRRERIDLIVCLADLAEVRAKSLAYSVAIQAKTVPCAHRVLAIPDWGVPRDRQAFWALAMEVAARLRAGERVLVHCGAGIGRTGAFAISVLLALGEPRPGAQQAVQAAGSHPETPAQQALLAWCAGSGSLA